MFRSQALFSGYDGVSAAVAKRIRIPEDDLTFWIGGDGTAQYRGATSAEVEKKVLEVARITEQWLKLYQYPATKISNAVPENPKRIARAASFRCGYCDRVFISEQHKEQHTIESHVAQDGDRSPEALRRPLVYVGNEIFERDRLPKMGTVAKPTGISQAAKSATKKPAVRTVSVSPKKAGSVSRLTRCECGSDVRVERIVKHRLKRCPAKIQAPTPRRPPPVRPIAPVKQKSRDLGTKVPGIPKSRNNMENQYLEDRRLDGARDFYRYREGGRFGSHPSFDACDDESKP